MLTAFCRKSVNHAIILIMAYEPPKSKWDVNIQFNEPLDADSELYVDSTKVRGDFSFDELFSSLGIDSSDQSNLTLKKYPEYENVFFGGHWGSGKSTELKRFSDKTDKDGLYFVIFLDVTMELDLQNLQYEDVLIALAKKLFEKLAEKNITPDKKSLAKLNDWFKEKIEESKETQDYASELKAGAEAKGEVPFFFKIFAKLTNSIRYGTSYRVSLRQVISNSFSEYARAFNDLVRGTEDKLKDKRKVIFNLALLEYEDGGRWLQSHPVVRTLDEYKNVVLQK